MLKAILVIAATLALIHIGASALEEPEDTPTLTDLKSVEELKAQFNSDNGKRRLLVLFSPTCTMCVDGASWVRENVLKKYPEAELEVYVVWFSMIPGDRKERWNPEILDDKRVTQYWDEKRVLGKWISKNIDGCTHLGPIDWDSYYLFDSDGKWSEVFEGVKACGSPILGSVEPFTDAIAELLKQDESE